MIDGKRRLVLFIVNGRYHPGGDRQLDENVMVFRVVTPLARAMHNCNLKLLLKSCLWQSILSYPSIHCHRDSDVRDDGFRVGFTSTAVLCTHDKSTMR